MDVQAWLGRKVRIETLTRLRAAASWKLEAKVAAPAWQRHSARSSRGELAIKLGTHEVQFGLCETRGNRHRRGRREVLKRSLPSKCLQRHAPLIDSQDGELHMARSHKHHPTSWTPPFQHGHGALTQLGFDVHEADLAPVRL